MSRTLTVVLLLVLCSVAAGVGSYVATMQSRSAVAIAPAASPANTVTPSAPATQTAAPVANTPSEPPPAQAPVTAAAAEVLAPPVAAPEPAPMAKPVKAAASKPTPKPSRAAAAHTPAPTHSQPVATATELPAPPVAAPAQAAPPQVEAPVPPPQPKPAMKAYEEFVVPAESVLGLQLLTTVSTETSRVEDPVEAKITRDLRVGGTVVIPAGTRVLGSVTEIERGGKIKGRSRLGVRFNMLILADATATRVPIRTDAVFRESESQGQQSAAKIGAAAVGGAILGAIIGGGKGAAIGGAVGAGSGTAAAMNQDAPVVTLPSGTAISIRLQDAVAITIER